MSVLCFEVEANYDEVIRLRKEINRLESELRHFDPSTATRSISQIESQLKSTRLRFQSLTDEAIRAGVQLEMNIRKGANGAIDALNNLQSKLADPISGLTQIAGVAGLGLFLDKITKVRGQFQQMETSIEVLLGNEERAAKLMAQLTEYAKQSPLDFQGTVNAAQMMLGFGLDAEKVPQYLQAIGDVAMGDAQRFQSLTLAFSQMSAAGKLMGQDLMQMVNAGFQPLDQLAKDTGKSIGQLKEEMSQGKISAEMVQQAFINATSEGGKFYKMSEQASQTIGGQMSMLQDAMDLMYNDLGKKSEDTILKAIQGATWLVENYEKVGGVLLTMLATYGIYRTSVMASEFAIKAQAEDSTRAIVQGFEEQIAKMKELQDTKKMAAYDSDLRDAMSNGTITEDMGAKIQSMRDELRLEEQLAQSAKDVADAKVEAAQKAVDSSQKAIDAAQEQVKAADEHMQSAMASLDLQEIAKAREEENAAQIALTTATREHDTAVEALATAETAAATAQTELNSAAERANAASVISNTSATSGNTAAQAANTAAQSRNAVVTALVTAKNKAATVAQHLWTGAVNMTTRAVNALKVAWASNPIGLIITALTTAIGLFMTFKDETEEASAEVERFGENAVKTKANVEVLYGILQSVNKESKVYKDALEELTKTAQEHGIVINKEKDIYEQLIANRERLIELIIEEGRQRQLANQIASYQGDMDKASTSFVDEMTKSIKDESNGDAEEYADKFARIIQSTIEAKKKDVATMVEEYQKFNAEMKDYIGQNGWDSKAYEMEDKLAQMQTDIAKAVNTDAKAFAKQLNVGEDYALDIKKTVELTEKYLKDTEIAQKSLNATIQQAEESKAITEANTVEVDFTTAGMDMAALTKSYKDFKKELDEINDTEVKPEVDASQIDAATESAEEAKDGVNVLDASSATPTTDNSAIDSTTTSAQQAAGAMGVLNKASAAPYVETKWLDGFTTKLNDAWMGLQKFFGVENPTQLIKTSEIKPQKKTKKQKAETALTDIKTAISEQIKGANTTNKIASARKYIREIMGDLDQDSADYKWFDSQLKALDKKDKSKKNNKSGAKDDPKQRAYEAEKARLDEQRRTNDMMLAEENRRIDLELEMRKDSSEKEIAVIHQTAKKKREALLEERRKEAERLEKFEMQQWLKAGKNRKEYQYYTQFSDAQLAKMRELWTNQAGENIGFNTQLSQIDFTEEQGIRKVQKEIADTMLNYLKEFGSFQQKRFAIEQEYAEKIANAKNEAEKKMFEAQKSRELGKLDIEALKQQIDWGSLFGDFGTMLSDQVQPTIEKLEAITKTDDFRNSTFEEQKAIFEIISTLKGSITQWDNNILGTLGDAVVEYQNALRANSDAMDNESRLREIANDKAEKLRKIQEANQLARQKGEEANMAAENAAREEATQAEQALATAAERTAQTTSDVANAQQNLATATNTAREMFSQLASGLQGLASGSLQGVWRGMNQLSKLFTGNNGLEQKMGGALIKGVTKLFGEDSKVGKAAADALKSLGGDLLGGIVESVFAILDILKDGIGNFIAQLIDTVLGAVNGLLNSILSGEIVTSVGKSVLNGVGSILDTISFGGFSSLMNKWGLSGESDKNYERDMERLSMSNDALRKSIDDLADEMRDASIADMVELYATQKDALTQSMNNTQEMMKRSGAAYSNGFLGIGGHKSSNHKINKGMSNADWQRITKAAGVSVKSASDFFNLTSEQMAKVAKDAPDLYAKLKSLADDGYQNAAQYMDEYIQYYKELQELENAYRENLTDVSFDSIKDEFKSALLDMESSTEDFANNFEKMMQSAVINALVNSKYNDAIQKWYEDFAAAMESDNELTAAEQRKLKKQYDDIVAGAINERDQIAKAMGWDTSSSQQSSSRSLAGMSQDTGDAIEGRLTALQIAVEAIRVTNSESAKNFLLQNTTLDRMDNHLLELLQDNTQIHSYYDNVQRMMAKSYIELQGINENTGRVVKPIMAMQESLKAMEQKIKYL